MPNTARDNREYRDLSNALRRKARREGSPCWICGHPIAWDAHWKDRMSFTYDHVDAVANGGSMRGAGRVAHRGCNSRRGNRKTDIAPVSDSREW